ncbi:MAG TPA: penicillin-binding protein 2 [Clostridiales bacterium]|nr:penicillin-binding protein 2 [Clostridiales bacterium]
MTGEIKQNGFFIFDQAMDGAIKKEEHPGLFKRIRQFFLSRYSVLALCFLLAGSMIFYNTAALQLGSIDTSGISETRGVTRQQTVSAARGEIFDSAGIPLAYSKEINTLSITYAGLDNDQLNRMLLDFSRFLEINQIEIEEDFSEYLMMDHINCNHQAGEGEDCGIPSFAKSAEITAAWQRSSNIFGLAAPPDGHDSTFDDKFIKSDPQIFFDYLLYKIFKIEDPEADGQKFSREDAYRIMKLRYQIMINSWAFRNGTPIEIARGVSDQIVSQVNEQNYRFSGVITGKKHTRAYTSEAAYISHVLGYVGRITATQLEDLRLQGYSADAVIGKDGVEATAERYLAGQDGIKPYNIWSVAGENGTFYSESIGKDAIPGNNVQLTIDLELQKVAARSLQTVIENIRNSPNNKNKGDADAGAVVMLDVNTGEILAMASFPDYNPNDFILQQTDEAAAGRVAGYLTDNVAKPLWNRAIQEIYAPGSTFKACTSVAALESGVITPYSSTIRCVGTETIGDWLWRCLEYPNRGHGNLNLTEALATSCNMYFFNLGFRTGINQIDTWGQKLGLGEYTGIDLPGEAKGFRSSRTTKKLLRSNPSDQIWFPADTCQTAIGQFDNSFTIIQLASYTVALATGNKITPHVIDKITASDGTIVVDYEYAPQLIGISESTLAAVRKGMVAVASDPEGTAYRAFKDFPVPVAAKTGTAETGFEDRSSSNGLFICYAPADNPQVAIAQIVEKGAWGSNTIGIAKDLLTAYFGLVGSN